MAKTAKLKKSAKSSSLHSRAAKRAASPSIDIDKSLKTIKAPAEAPNHRPSVLSTHHGAGISKRKGKSQSRHQRLRQEKVMQRAEAVMDKTERKLEKNYGKLKVIKERGAAWDALNNKIQDKKSKAEGNSFEEDGWVDDETDTEMDVIALAQASDPVAAIPLSIASESVVASTEPLVEEEDVIL